MGKSSYRPSGWKTGCLLHEGHPGISKMKLLARQVVWDITGKVQTCEKCQVNQKSPAHGNGLGQDYTLIIWLVVHSKWIEAVTVSSTSSAATIRVLRNRLPELIFSDNGTSFTSEEFQAFAKSNGIRHRTTAPCYQWLGSTSDKERRTRFRFAISR